LLKGKRLKSDMRGGIQPSGVLPAFAGQHRLRRTQKCLGNVA
jgi:hypothetical protein